MKIVYSAREKASRAFPSLYIGRLDNLIVRTGLKSMDDSAEESYYARQLVRLAEGEELDSKIRSFKSSFFFLSSEFLKAKACKKASQ